MKRCVILVLFLSFTVYLLHGQDKYLQINGYVETLNGEVISGAKATVYVGNTVINSKSTDSEGRFSFNLDYGKLYKVIIEKSGMIQKRIDFNTEVPEDKQKKYINDFAVTLTKTCDGANTSVFSEPVDIISFEEGINNFSSNKAHYEKMQSRFTDAFLSIEKCFQDKFNEKKDAADQAFNEGKFEEARKLYNEALTIKPGDKSAIKQLSQIDKSIEKEKRNSALYDQLVKEGNQLAEQGQLNGAKAKFEQASKLKPGDTFSQQKLQEINTELAEQAQAAQQQQIIDNKYNNLVAQANSAMTAQQYSHAKELFEQAKELKPDEAFPEQRIAEAQRALEKQEQQRIEKEKNDKAFADAMAQAQEAMQKGEYVKAQELYQSALTYNPNAAEPRQQIVQAQKLEAKRKEEELKAQKEEIDRQFNEAVQKADGLLAQKEYDQAIAAYKRALEIKPSDKYAGEQIIKAQNQKVADEQNKIVAIEQKYSEAISKGDALKLAQQYQEAITAYKQALEAKPSDPVAASKLSEAEKLYTDKQAKLKEETEDRAKFNQLVQEGDGLFYAKNYEDAKQKYLAALNIYSSEPYPKNQVTKIDNILAINSKESEYNQVIAEADQAFDQKQLDKARSLYTQAKKILPKKTYPSQRLNEISSLESDLARQEKQAEYDQLTAKAEEAVVQKSYDQAKQFYAQAAAIFPDNTYPQQRINEINALIDGSLHDAEEQVYNNLITQADKLFNDKNYEAAKNIYSQAKLKMPEKTYPDQKINEINMLLTQMKRYEVTERYNKLISEADNLFDQKLFEQARTTYQKASSVVPEQTYPQKRINEINSLLAEQVNNQREKQEIKERYDKTIALADKYFNEENYILARTEYSNALTIYPDEQYPKTQLSEIEKRVADQRRKLTEKQELEKRLRETLNKADQLFKERKYAEAKSFYSQALDIKPDNVHAASQIQRIDEFLEKENKQKLAQQEVEDEYKKIIMNADAKFSLNDYKLAKKLYLSALEIKPNESYPRQQIKKIDDSVRALASSQHQVNRETVSGNNSGASGKDIADLSFRNENERIVYLNELKKKYPKGITLEIYKDGKKTVKRYIVYRGEDVHEFREVSFTWGGVNYTYDGKPTTELHVRSIVKPRNGEYYKETTM